MQKRNRKQYYQDKIIIGVIADVKNMGRAKHLDSYTYISNLVDKIIKNKNVSTDRVFIGGDKEDLLIFLSNIIWNYQFKDIYIEDYTKYYNDDTDFDLCQSTFG